jgi:hypothetical protein
MMKVDKSLWEFQLLTGNCYWFDDSWREFLFVWHVISSQLSHICLLLSFGRGLELFSESSYKLYLSFRKIIHLSFMFLFQRARGWRSISEPSPRTAEQPSGYARAYLVFSEDIVRSRGFRGWNVRQVMWKHSAPSFWKTLKHNFRHDKLVPYFIWNIEQYVEKQGSSRVF